MGYSEATVQQLVTILRALRLGGCRLERHTRPSDGVSVLVLRGGRPSIEDYPVPDADQPGTSIVGVIRRSTY